MSFLPRYYNENGTVKTVLAYLNPMMGGIPPQYREPNFRIQPDPDVDYMYKPPVIANASESATFEGHQLYASAEEAQNAA